MRSGPSFCWATRDPAKGTPGRLLAGLLSGRRAWELRRRHASFLRRAGNLAPETLTPQRLRANSASETLVGSDMPFLHVALPFENARCFRPWLLPLEPSSTLNPVRMLVCGWPRYLRMRRPPSHRTSCTSQYGAAFACPAPHGPALWSGRPIWLWVRGRMRMETTTSPAPSRPRRGFVVERAWTQVAREAVGLEGRVVP